MLSATLSVLPIHAKTTVPPQPSLLVPHAASTKIVETQQQTAAQPELFQLLLELPTHTPTLSAPLELIPPLVPLVEALHTLEPPHHPKLPSPTPEYAWNTEAMPSSWPSLQSQLSSPQSSSSDEVDQDELR